MWPAKMNQRPISLPENKRKSQVTSYIDWKPYQYLGSMKLPERYRPSWDELEPTVKALAGGECWMGKIKDILPDYKRMSWIDRQYV